ncbi:hypothetical protein HYT92_01575 [Candidatus Pacearchaeota archaeon]|nr:hypothetical protein [Candidatus Pacearchaeota archaeon]
MKLIAYSRKEYSSVPVCDSCLKGSHLDPCGHDHRGGLRDDRGDCKNSEGEIQCNCGLGGYVYNTKTGRLEKSHYKEECLPCKVDEMGGVYFEDTCKKDSIKIPETVEDTFFCIDCGWAILDGDTIIV